MTTAMQLEKYRFLAGILCLVLLLLQITGCASDSYAAKGAAKGGGTGAAAGAVGGLVTALVFGGDPGKSMAQGAVYGGASGATAGAIAGSEVDRKLEEKEANQQQQLREKLGPDTYGGLEALARCDHAVALSQANKAQQNKNPNYALAGLWLEVLSYADQGNESRARAMFPTVVEKDWNITTTAQAEEKMRKAMSNLMTIREKHQLPRVCS